MNPQPTIQPENTDLGQFVAALYGASKAPFRLIYGDTTVDVTDDLTPAQTAAGAVPLMLSMTTAQGGVPFLYATTDEPTDDAWEGMLSPDLAVYPTAILTKGCKVHAVYALSYEAADDDDAVIALAAAMGTPLETPLPTPGADGWTLVHFDADRHTALEGLQDAFGTVTAPAVVDRPPTSIMGLGQYKDATIRSVFNFEDAHLNDPVTVSIGMGVKETNWKPIEMTRLGVLDTFCVNRVVAKKDDRAIVLGKLPPPNPDARESNRRNAEVEEMHFVALDFDTGIDGDDLARVILDSGLMAVMASSYSHLKTTTVEEYKHFPEWMVEQGMVDKVEDAVVDLAVVRARMGSAPKNILPQITDTMTFEVTGKAPDEGEEDKRDIIITHAPLQKWRVVFAFDRPFVMAEHTTEDEEGWRAWRRVVPALVKMLGDPPYDHACVDGARLWYLPSRPADDTPFRIDLFGGDLLKLDDVLAQAALMEDDDDLVSGPALPDGVDPDSFEGRLLTEVASYNVRRDSDGKESSSIFTPYWAATRADGLDIVKLLNTKLAKGTPHHKKLRGWSDGKKKRVIECPFNGGHGNSRDKTDTGCFASSPHGNRGFTIYCSHGSCKSQKRDRLAYLGKMVEDGWFTVEDVEAFDEIDRTVPVIEYQPKPVIQAAAQPVPATSKSLAAPGLNTFDYPMSKLAPKFEVTKIDGRNWFSFKEEKDDDGKVTRKAERAFTRWSLVGGAIHPDRENIRDLEIAYENEQGERQTFRMDATKASAKTWTIAQMRGQGIAFSPKGQESAHTIIMANQPTNHVIRDKTGWLEDGSFMLPTGVYLGGGGDVRLSDIKRIDAAPTAGTLEGWKAGAEAACAANSPSLHAGLLAGFAGPLTGLTGHSTLVVAFTGTTTEGKTWRQQTGVAISGPPEPGVGQMKSMNSTVGALEVPIERGSCTIAAFDELQHAEAEDVQDLIFRATGQQGRARLSQSGGAGLTRAWRGGVVTLSTETGLAQQLRLSGARMAGGMTVRLIEVDVTVGRLDDDEWDKANAMLANYGHAMPVLIEEIRRQGYVDRPADLGKRVKAFTQKLPDTDTPVAMRAATAIGYLCVAGEIAKSAGLLPTWFDVDAVGRTLWEGALGSGVKPEDPINRAIETLLESVNTRRHEIYEDDDDRFQTREAVAWVSQYAPTGEKVYCLREKFLSKWSGGAADEKALKKALLDRGIAIPRVREKTVDGKTVKSTMSVWRSWKKPVGSTPVIVLRASAIDGEDAPIPIGG